MSLLLGILTFILILVSLFLILVVLAQKSKDGGMGAALGGGAAEAAFGAETGNVLSKSTIYAAVVFFVLAFALYLGRIYERKHVAASEGNALPTIAAPALPLPNPSAGTLPPGAAPESVSPAVTVPLGPTLPNTGPASTSPAAGAPPSTAPITTPAVTVPITPTPAPEAKKP